MPRKFSKLNHLLDSRWGGAENEKKDEYIFIFVRVEIVSDYIMEAWMELQTLKIKRQEREKKKESAGRRAGFYFYVQVESLSEIQALLSHGKYQ